MDGDSRLGVASCLHGLVNMVTPHALTTVPWQQGWMNVDNTAWEGINEEIRYHGQKTGEDDELNTVLLQQG